MSNFSCRNCGQINQAEAEVCVRCGFSLKGTGWAGDPSRDDYRRPSSEKAGAGRRTLPSDFPVPAFERVADALKPTLRVYRTHFVLIGKIVLALTLPLAVTQYFYLHERGLGLSLLGLSLWLLSAAIGALLPGALIYAIVTLLRTGAEPPLGACFRWALKKWWKVVACQLLYSMLTGLGFLLLIVPGIIWSVTYALVVPVAVIEDRGVGDTFYRSDRLTSGRRWLIFGTWFIFWLIIFLVSLITSGGFVTTGEVEDSLLAAVFGALVSQMLQSSFVVLTLFIYLGVLAGSGEGSVERGQAVADV